MKRLQKGFTLIELLIVIAIIGILAGLVIVNFSAARNRAKDARLISGLAQLRSEKEINYDGALYKAVSANLRSDINLNSKSSSFNENFGATYVAWAELNIADGNLKYYCVDSEGASKKTATAPTKTTSATSTTPAVVGSTKCP